MAGNTIGNLFKVTTYGESHGSGIGAIIDGCPAGLAIDADFVQSELDRRRPGQSKIVTQRKESDTATILSGIFDGMTTGMPIAIHIPNEDQKSKDYDHIKDVFRPSHADFTYQNKFGLRDHRGGGRSSARETAARVASGAIAKLLLKEFGISIYAYVSQVGSIKMNNILTVDFSQIEQNIVRCPDINTADQMIDLISSIRKQGDTIGGMVTCQIIGCPVGLGEPVFDRLHADLAKAMMSINAAKGFEYGSGFDCIEMKGSEHNDAFISNDSKEVSTTSNHSGGIQGGISNGMPIYFNVAFKPVATIVQSQNTVDVDGNAATAEGKGRHDPCVVPRAVPIVEAMAAIILADHLLRHRSSQL
jgi:chorismate synthase